MANLDWVAGASRVAHAARAASRSGRWAVWLAASLLGVGCGRTELNRGSLVAVGGAGGAAGAGAAGGAPSGVAGAGISCATGQLTCPGADGPVCVDSSSDPNNCGACGLPCPLGETCVGARCSCTGPNCDDSCQAPLASCVDGRGLEECVDLQTSRDNCGSCQQSCANDEACEQGVCVRCEPTNFHLPVAYETGQMAWASSTPPLVADVDADGNLDVLVASTGGASVSLFRGDGHGGLQERELIDSVQAPTALATADLNRDGLPEILVAGSGGVRIHWNDLGVNGSTSFLDGGANAWASTKFMALALVELSGDDLPEIVLVGQVAAGSQVWLVRGAEPYAKSTPELLLSSSELFRRLQVDDLNQDGFLDIVAWALNGDVLWGGADGSWTPQPGFVDGGALGEVPLRYVDMNADGFVDRVNVSSSGFEYDVKVRLGAAGGGLTLVPDDSAPGNYATRLQVQVDDFNQDGVPDVLMRSDESSRFSAYWGRGDGTFEPPVNSAMPSGTGGFALADFNRDGLLDVAALHSGASALTIHRGLGGGAVDSYLLGMPARSFLRGVAVETYADQTQPLVATVGGLDLDTGRFRVLRYDGARSLVAEQETPIYRPLSLALSDVDGDGQKDALIPAEEDFYWLEYEGNGSFGEPQVIEHRRGGTEPIAGDVTGDGVPEVFIRQVSLSNDIIHMYNRVGSGWAPTRWDVGGSASFALGDVTGDSLPDVVVVVGSELKVYQALAGLAPQLRATVKLPQTFARVQLIDLTGDGIDDVLVGDWGGYAALQGGPQLDFPQLATAGRPTLYDVFFYSTGRATQLDGDAFGDFIESQAGGVLSFWHGLGDGKLERSEQHPVPGASNPVGVADFTQDGLPDLLLTGGGQYDGALALLAGVPKCGEQPARRRP